MRDLTEAEQLVIAQVKDMKETGLDFPTIILGLQIEDAAILQHLVDKQSKEFFASYSKDKESYNLWEKLCDFIYNIFGHDYSKTGINGKNSVGATPLHMLAGSEIMVKMLLDMGADVNITDDKGETPILLAGSLNKLAIVKIMHAEGADLNVKNNIGDNLLASLIRDHKPNANRDLTEVFKYLIEQGVNPNEKNQNTGRSALDIAKESNYSHSLKEIFTHDRQSEIAISK